MIVSSAVIKVSQLARYLLIAALLISHPLQSRETEAGAGSACELQGGLDDALSREGLCARNPDFLHWLGRLLMQSGRHDEAVDRIEMVLLLDPSRWSAHLDYAYALDLAGDWASSLAILRNLLANPSVDVGLRKEISRYLLDMPSVVAIQRGMIGLAFGYDNNLMGATRHDRFSLSLPEGPLPVETIKEQRPRSGRFLRLDGIHQILLSDTSLARWQASVIFSHRWSADYAPASRTNLGLVLERTPLQERGLYGVVQVQAMQRDGGLAFRQSQLAVGYEQFDVLAGQECRWRVGFEAWSIQYPGDALFDGRYRGVQGQIHCPRPHFALQWRMGSDDPGSKSRPGGRQEQAGLRLLKQFRLGEGGLIIDYDVYHQRDQSGYSVLLENNAPRRILRQVYRIEYQWRLGPLSPYVAFEHLDQRSNLPLFSPQNQMLSVGVRRVW